MLSFVNVDVSISGIQILRDVSFKIEPAQTIAMIGHNGAGKTTTLRAAMGLVDSRGTMSFDGKPLHKTEPFKRANLGIGYAPEDRRLFSAFTVEENIRLAGQVAQLSDTALSERFKLIYDILPELKEMADRPAGNVSGGQGKMVALGRALMIGQKLIMLDEPFQGLAPALAQRYSEALKKLRDADKKVSMIITESNPNLLKQFADRILLVERGEVSDYSS